MESMACFCCVVFGAPSKVGKLVDLSGFGPLIFATLFPQRGQLQVLGIDANNLKSDIASSSVSDDNRETLKPGQLSSIELESRQKLWRWLLLAGLACLLLESVLASIIQRTQVGSEA